MMSQQECPERREKAADEPEAELGAFSVAEKKRLMRLRRLVQQGERSERYPVDKRQDFVRWLVDQGKLSDT